MSAFRETARCIVSKLSENSRPPSSLPAPDELAAHLASCPSCARWSGQSAGLMRAWDETRIDDLPAPALDALWADAAKALDAAGSDLIPMPRRGDCHRGHLGWTRALIGLASAAAILAGVFLGNRPVATPDVPTVLANEDVRPDPASVVFPPFEVNIDETVFIRLGDGEPQLDRMIQVSTTPEFHPALADATPHLLMSAMESMEE